MSLDLKRKELELDRVLLGKKEMEFRIDERNQEIERLEENIKIQEIALEKLTAEIQQMKGK